MRAPHSVDNEALFWDGVSRILDISVVNFFVLLEDAGLSVYKLNGSSS